MNPSEGVQGGAGGQATNTGTTSSGEELWTINLTKVDIAMGAGRPARHKIINQDDIQNLKIALNTCKSIDEFLQLV